MDKLSESEARVLALQIAVTFPNHEASTEDIKRLAPKYRELTDPDLEPSASRANEEKWQQIIGNATGSHNKPERRSSLFSQGLAEKTNDGIRVTKKCIEFLRGKGLYK
jgi:MoxR-like ATPase